MNGNPSGRAWTRWILGLLMAGALTGTVFAARDQASGAAAPSPTDTVVLTGSYSCSLHSYYVLPPPPPPVPRPSPPVPDPTPDPGSAPAPEPEADDPVPVRELTHYVSITGTGALTALPAGSAPAPAVGPGTLPGIGPGFGGRGSFVGQVPAPINLGSGVSAGFDGGTAEDCVRFAHAVAAVANGLGCVTSPVRTRPGVPIVTEVARFSFVCEGPAAVEVHAIGELDRAVLAQRIAP